MQTYEAGNYDVIVVGAGHAGSERRGRGCASDR